MLTVDITLSGLGYISLKHYVRRILEGDKFARIELKSLIFIEKNLHRSLEFFEFYLAYNYKLNTF